MSKTEVSKPFSDQLEAWIKGKQPKTLANLIELFGEKSFAVLMVLFMFLPALPLPTGGVTHVLEIVTALLAIEQIIGLKKIWLPQFLGKRIKLEKLLKGKLAKVLLERLRWFEKRSKPRWTWLFRTPLVSNLIGLVVLGLTTAAFFSPPFSGLDTLPSLGVVLISLAVILEDAIMLVAGVVIGALGVVLSIGLGAAITKFIHHLFKA